MNPNGHSCFRYVLSSFPSSFPTENFLFTRLCVPNYAFLITKIEEGKAEDMTDKLFTLGARIRLEIFLIAPDWQYDAREFPGTHRMQAFRRTNYTYNDTVLKASVANNKQILKRIKLRAINTSTVGSSFFGVFKSI